MCNQENSKEENGNFICKRGKIIVNAWQFGKWKLIVERIKNTSHAIQWFSLKPIAYAPLETGGAKRPCLGDWRSRKAWTQLKGINTIDHLKGNKISRSRTLNLETNFKRSKIFLLVSDINTISNRALASHFLLVAYLIQNLISTGDKKIDDSVN